MTFDTLVNLSQTSVVVTVCPRTDSRGNRKAPKEG